MALKTGIVGLPNVGKSTLFNAITKMNILAANYPFATIEPNVGVVIVPDERLDVLNDIYKPKRLVPTTIEFTDIAGLVKGASKGEGLGNKFLSFIREVDAIVEVVRCFENKEITHVEGDVNPIRDIQIINAELIISDLEVLENRINKIGKRADMTKDKSVILEVNTINKAKTELLKENALRNVEFSSDELNILKSFNLITLKPIIYVANIDENDIGLENEYVLKVKNEAKNQNAQAIVMCAKIESDLIGLAEKEKEEFLQELGIEQTGLNRLIQATYKLLGLETFFTCGSDEVKAWTFCKGMKAPQCAGIIHTDFQRGFIKAEVISYDDLILYNNEKKVQEAGKLRLEGKEYIMQDGDICYFRFNV